MKTKCHVRVRYEGLSFPRFHQCCRNAVTVDGEGNPVCKQHSPAAKAERQAKADKINDRKSKLYLALIASKRRAKITR
jgi:hypothetical protein